MAYVVAFPEAPTEPPAEVGSIELSYPPMWLWCTDCLDLVEVADHPDDHTLRLMSSNTA